MLRKSNHKMNISWVFKITFNIGIVEQKSTFNRLADKITAKTKALVSMCINRRLIADVHNVRNAKSKQQKTCCYYPKFFN